MEKKVICGEQPVFTVLVAVYNAAPTIERCLDSLLAQTERCLQIVCVDDASTDNSLDILHSYRERDGRVEVVEGGENGGPAVARNRGLAVARGQYTAFLDSDDWFSPDALEKCREAFEADEKVDCVLFDVVYADDVDGCQKPHEGNMCGTISGQEAFEQCLTWGIHGWYAVRTDLHSRFPYDDSYRTYSDDNTTRLHYLHSRLVSSCRGKYFYFQRDESVTHTCDLSQLNRLFSAASMKRHLLALGVEDRLISVFETQRWLLVIDACFFLYCNRKILTKEDMQTALCDVRRQWESIEVRRVARRHRWHLGLWPLHFSWRLFCLQEWMYFTLRRLAGHDR